MTGQPCYLGRVRLVPRASGAHLTDLCACRDFRGLHKDSPAGPGTGPCQRTDCTCTNGHDYLMIDTEETAQ